MNIAAQSSVISNAGERASNVTWITVPTVSQVILFLALSLQELEQDVKRVESVVFFNLILPIVTI